MEDARKRDRRLDGLWLLLWGLASSVWCITAACELGPTFDEPLYVARGLEGWRTGSHRGLIKLGTMPLPIDVQTLPLYLWERMHGFQWDADADLDRILPWARGGTLVFWWLLLFYALKSGRLLAGPWAGRWAVALLACEPSLLAHASLATTDIAVTACLLALVYHFHTGRERSWWRRVGLPAVWLAAALCAKASGVVFAPFCLFAVEMTLLSWQSVAAAQGIHARIVAFWQTTKAFRRDVVQLIGCGTALAFVYCGCDWQPEPSFVAWAHGLPDGIIGRTAAWLADHLCIFSNAGEGIVRQVKHNIRGHGAYLLGVSSPRAIWYYFPLALTIKLSTPLLLLMAGLTLLRPRALVNWACLAAGFLLLFSLNCRVQIGIRLVLPLVALGVIGLAAAIARAWEEVQVASTQIAPGILLRRWLAPACLVVAVGWTTTTAIRVWPHGLCYTNELWGGTRSGYLRLSDSNYDWGQGLHELARWEEKQGVPMLDVWYFGSDPDLKRLPMRELPFHNMPIQSPDDVRAWVRGHYLAVSTTLLYGTSSDTESRRQTTAFLRSCKPIARTTTFLIYDFREDTRRVARK
jgi:hypothetical protein